MTAVLDAIDSLIASAEHDYATPLGGEAACTLHRDGRVTGGMTYHEGRLVALREARRIVEGSMPTEWRHELAELRNRWAADLETRKTSRINTPPWVAYATGGHDAAAEALAVIEAEA